MWRRSSGLRPTCLSKRYSSIHRPFATTANDGKDDAKPMLLTTPIFYVNAEPHIGHVHSAVLTDAMTRWFQLKNKSVRFTTGTDEHGLKVQEAAEASGTTDYKSFCDSISARFQSTFDQCDVQYSRYIRTSEPDHHKAVEVLWRTIRDNGYIYLGEHESWYCKSDESFLTDLQVEDSADGEYKISKESGHRVEKLREENYKFKLSAFQDQLLEWLDANPDAVVPPSRHNEVRATVEAGLRDISVSRLRSKIQWAIDVPDDDSHCVYVWLDALTNYLTCAGYPGQVDAWPADYHIVGKDILKFHAIYWPAFLMAAGLPLPKRIVAHSHWTVDNVKMSKSLGNVVNPLDLLKLYGPDPVRFFLLRDSVLSNDGDFNAKLLETRVNSELADTLGNLLSRSTGKAFLQDGRMPALPAVLGDEEESLKRKAEDLLVEVERCFEVPDFHNGLQAIVRFLYDVNGYFTTNAPWVLNKKLKQLEKDSDEYRVTKERLDTVLYTSIDAVRVCTILLQPAIPSSASRILDRIGTPAGSRTVNHAKLYLDQPGIMTDQIDHKTPFVAFPKIQLE